MQENRDQELDKVHTQPKFVFMNLVAQLEHCIEPIMHAHYSEWRFVYRVMDLFLGERSSYLTCTCTCSVEKLLTSTCIYFYSVYTMYV